MTIERGRTIEVRRTQSSSIEIWEGDIIDEGLDPNDDQSWYDVAVKRVSDYDYDLVFGHDFLTLEKWEDDNGDGL